MAGSCLGAASRAGTHRTGIPSVVAAHCSILLLGTNADLAQVGSRWRRGAKRQQALPSAQASERLAVGHRRFGGNVGLRHTTSFEEPPITEEIMNLRALLQKSSDAVLSR